MDFLNYYLMLLPEKIQFSYIFFRMQSQKTKESCEMGSFYSAKAGTGGSPNYQILYLCKI